MAAEDKEGRHSCSRAFTRGSRLNCRIRRGLACFRLAWTSALTSTKAVGRDLSVTSTDLLLFGSSQK